MKRSEFTLHLGDCIDVMRGMADNSVDSIVTDPPYHLTTDKKGGCGQASVNLNTPQGRARIGTGFMGMKWDGGEIAFSPELWVEALRVLKPGGHLLAFSGSRTYHRMAVAIEDAGFEIRDQIMWIYGSGFPKSRNIAEQDMGGADAETWEGWGTALKPAHEPICFARKPLSGTVAANVLTHGTGAINVDGCRVHGGDAQGGSYTVKRLKPGATLNETGGNWRPEGADAALFHGQMKAGRWPANIIHDGSGEVLASFPDAPGQMGDASASQGPRPPQSVYGALRRGSQEASAGSDNCGAVGFKMKPGARRLDSGSAARFFYCAKASRSDRNAGLVSSPAPAVETSATMRNCETAEWRTRNGNHHPTVKPTDLMSYLVRLVTPPGGLVLDPFMGSGSTGKACMREGMRFVGIDMGAEYVEIARTRIAHEADAVAEASRIAAIPPAQADLFGAAA